MIRAIACALLLILAPATALASSADKSGAGSRTQRAPAASAKKLIKQLKGGSKLSCDELRKILRYVGYALDRQSGSHEQWVRNGTAFTVACHGKDTKDYQRKNLLEVVEGLEASGELPKEDGKRRDSESEDEALDEAG